MNIELDDFSIFEDILKEVNDWKSESRQMLGQDADKKFSLKDVKEHIDFINEDPILSDIKDSEVE